MNIDIQVLSGDRVCDSFPMVCPQTANNFCEGNETSNTYKYKYFIALCIHYANT